MKRHAQDAEHVAELNRIAEPAEFVVRVIFVAVLAAWIWIRISIGDVP